MFSWMISQGWLPLYSGIVHHQATKCTALNNGSTFRSFHSLLEYEDDDIEEVFCLNFIVSREVLGEVKTTELKPGGANIPVTQSNKWVVWFFIWSYPLSSVTFQARVRRSLRWVSFDQISGESIHWIFEWFPQSVRWPSTRVVPGAWAHGSSCWYDEIIYFSQCS